MEGVVFGLIEAVAFAAYVVVGAYALRWLHATYRRRGPLPLPAGRGARRAHTPRDERRERVRVHAHAAGVATQRALHSDEPAWLAEQGQPPLTGEERELLVLPPADWHARGGRQ